MLGTIKFACCREVRPNSGASHFTTAFLIWDSFWNVSMGRFFMNILIWWFLWVKNYQQRKILKQSKQNFFGSLFFLKDWRMVMANIQFLCVQNSFRTCKIWHFQLLCQHSKDCTFSVLLPVVDFFRQLLFGICIFKCKHIYSTF